MIEKLIEQGVTDIEYIEGTDGVKFRVGAAAAAPGTPTRRSANFADAGSPGRPNTAANPNNQNRRRHGGGGQSTLQLF